jgi:2'-5' RNA ligase
MTGSGEAPKRCFVGVWPDDVAASQLDALTLQLNRSFPHARRVPRANLHLTISFIGDIDAAAAACVAARLKSLACDRFMLTLDRIGAFDGPRVAWAGGPTTPELQALVSAVQHLLDEEHVRFDRRPFVPHVTLLRHLPRTVQGLARTLDPPIPWTAQAPVLLQSCAGRYVEVAPAA